jgi:hypothetical protein
MIFDVARPNLTDMKAITISILILVLIVFAIPFSFAIVGLVLGAVGGVIGFIFGVIGAVIGGIFELFGWIISLPFQAFHCHVPFVGFWSDNMFALAAVVLLVVILAKARR